MNQVKDNVEEHTDGKERCISNSTDVYEHGMCVLTGSIDTYEYQDRDRHKCVNIRRRAWEQTYIGVLKLEYTDYK